MDIRFLDFLGKSKKVLHSEAAESGAKRLLKSIESGDMGLEILPKNFQHTGSDYEEKNYVSYCDFLYSVNGKKVLEILEEEDERELFEL